MLNACILKVFLHFLTVVPEPRKGSVSEVSQIRTTDGSDERKVFPNIQEVLLTQFSPLICRLALLLEEIHKWSALLLPPFHFRWIHFLSVRTSSFNEFRRFSLSLSLSLSLLLSASIELKSDAPPITHKMRRTEPSFLQWGHQHMMSSQRDGKGHIHVSRRYPQGRQQYW